MTGIDAYAVLGVGPHASQEQLKAAHRALLRRRHPDLVPPEERKSATRQVQDINVAYGLVRDPVRRSEYDRLRNQPEAAAFQAALRSAGRWAGRWWRRNRTPLRRSAIRMHEAGVRGGRSARRAGADLLGRILWLTACALGGGAGWLLAAGAQRLTGVDGVLTPLVATLGGLAVGNERGWRLRLRLAGLPTPLLAARLAPVVWVAATAAALWVEAGR